MLVQIVSELLPQLCSNDSIQIFVKMAWFLTLGTEPILRVYMRSSLIGGKILNFSTEAFFILILLNITTKLVISQISFLWRHHFGTLLGLHNKTPIELFKSINGWLKVRLKHKRFRLNVIFRCMAMGLETTRLDHI